MDWEVTFGLFLLGMGGWITFQCFAGIREYWMARNDPDDMTGEGEKASLVGLLTMTALLGFAAIFFGMRGLIG